MSSGRGDKEEVTWWGPSSISTMVNGSEEVSQFQHKQTSTKLSNLSTNSEIKPRDEALLFCHANIDNGTVIYRYFDIFHFTALFPDSGVGAGIDSYYEYLMKAYILLGDNVFLERFNIVSFELYAQLCVVLPIATT